MIITDVSETIAARAERATYAKRARETVSPGRF